MTDGVFSLGGVDGCFATDGGIDHGQQGAGDIDHWNATPVIGSDKADHIKKHTATERNQGGITAALPVEQVVFNVVLGGPGFVFFT